MKRLFDIVFAASVLLFLAPVLVLIAVSVKLSSPGPIFYGQTRVGLRGKLFRMWKFRSMVANAEQIQTLLRSEVGGPVFKLRDDPRVTSVGRWLRLHSLDELPQFWNVLVGDMSVVGPRPAIPAEVAKHEPWQRLRLMAKPGLTCIWQVSGRHLIGFEQWMMMDLEYIIRRGFVYDIYLVLATVPAMVWGHGSFETKPVDKVPVLDVESWYLEEES